ncbi:MAG: Uma2 family endonuclease [Deltaproteobacteria bacterium]|nr:Uma2 family endonuclease [Deltaproteobacteria bacterium]
MAHNTQQDLGYDVESYFDLLRGGVLQHDDRVELLDGVIVASPPQLPLHAAVIMRVDSALRAAVGDRVSVRVQLPLLAGPRSVPEPDVALVAGRPADYDVNHPTRAVLVVEIADSSLPQDRLSKARIYAGCDTPEYWIVNLRDRRLEIRTEPDRRARVYASLHVATMGDVVELVALRGARVAVADLLPRY